MEQHPIPQQISTYQFRLVGDMTLRQFSQLAGGVVVAIFFYSLPIISPIKWFLVLFFTILGFALAFLPLEDRPLDKWITAFFKSIYSPTRFIWQKAKIIPEFLEEKPLKKIKETTQAVPGEDQAAETLAEYFETFSAPVPSSQIEEQEKQALVKIEALFKTTKLPPSIVPQPKPIEDDEEEVMPQIKVKPRKLVVPPSESLPIKLDLSTAKVSKPPPQPQLKMKSKMKPKPSSPLRVKIAPKKRKDKSRVEAKTTADLPIPTTPTRPNLIVGMILDREGKMIENAIIEIRDKDGIPVRALRSNRLGQFQIVTPLSNGAYEMEVEKEGFDFDIIRLNLSGELVPPIEIRAK